MLRKSALPAVLVFKLAFWFSTTLTVAQVPLIGVYEFNNSYDNSYGTLPSLQPIRSPGDTIGFDSGWWVWNGATGRDGTGLSLSLPSPLSTYSIGMRFQLSDTDYYRKIIDFSGLISDYGLYDYYGVFRLYDTRKSGGSISPNTPVTIVFTRDDSTKTANLYVNGDPAPVLTATDLGSLFAETSVLHFFVDDSTTSGEYSPAGQIDELRIWNAALSSSQVPNAFAPIPEPRLGGLVTAAAILGLAVTRRMLRHRTSSTTSAS
ncbi:MAG: LamG domain-containing protein [Verrucomicrobia bacterium]|nr:LamG domain-containing protein [Verrucomicrobiota bacterium]